MPTDVGQVVFQYAEEIFALGRELVDTVKDRPTGRPLRLVGASPTCCQAGRAPPPRAGARARDPGAPRLPGGPADRCSPSSPCTTSTSCSPTRRPPGVAVRVFTHLLGECDVVLVAAPALAARHRRGFPRSLAGAPLLLPGRDVAPPALEQWLQATCTRASSASSRTARSCRPLAARAPACSRPTAIAAEVGRQYAWGRRRLGAVRERFYAISAERRLKHPAVVAIPKATQQVYIRPFTPP